MTLETTPDLLHTIRDLGTRADGILLDCLTLYVSGLLMAGSSELHVMQQVEALCLTLGQGRRPAAIVTNEVGCGVVPETALGRRFRDAAGGANQVAARHAQEVVLMISGIPVVIKGADIPSL
jgi:adenosylcobinamide kinase/adenosylcobinamide-phosphate guanylyltransferase